MQPGSVTSLRVCLSICFPLSYSLTLSLSLSHFLSLAFSSATLFVFKCDTTNRLYIKIREISLYTSFDVSRNRFYRFTGYIAKEIWSARGFFVRIHRKDSIFCRLRRKICRKSMVYRTTDTLWSRGALRNAVSSVEEFTVNVKMIKFQRLCYTR